MNEGPNYYDYIKNGGSLVNVPREFITQEMCDVYFKRITEEYLIFDYEFRKIPSEYKTREMCEKYIAKGGELSNVPIELITQEMCNIYAAKKRSLVDIPHGFRTKELYNLYIIKGGELYDVPKIYITREMCNAYIEQGGELYYVPQQFLNQEMCNTYIEQGGYISHVPPEFTTPLMFAQYSAKKRTINQMPDFLDADEVIKLYFDLMLKKYNLQYLKLDSMKAKAEEIFTQLLKDNYILPGHVLDFIPHKYISKKMIGSYLNEIAKLMNKSARDKYVKEFYNKLFTDTKNVNLIPKQYLTDKMKEYAVNNPDTVLPTSDIGQYLSKQQSKENTKSQIEKELYDLPKTLKTKNQLLREYGVTLVFIDNILEKIHNKDPEQYTAIQKILNNNSFRFKQAMIKNIRKMSIIIDSLGEIGYNSKLHRMGKSGKALNLEQKLKLAYLLGKSGVYTNNLHHIYEALNSEWILRGIELPENEITKVRNFFEILYVDTKKGSFQNLSKSEKFAVKANHSLRYLRRYTPESYFYDSKGKVVKHSILDVNNNITEINEENIKPVIEVLMSNDIPLLNVIINEASRVYFREGLDRLNLFVSKLHSYDVVAVKAKEYAGDTKLKIEKNNHKIIVVPMTMISNKEGEIKKAFEEVTSFGMKQR